MAVALRKTGLNFHNSSDELRLDQLAQAIGQLLSRRRVSGFGSATDRAGGTRAFSRRTPAPSLWVSVIGCLALVAGLASPKAAETTLTKPSAADSSIDPATSRLKFRVARGLKVDLFAAEPMVQNIVSFAFDEQGRCYVVESHRRRTSVFDIGNFPEWLEADFSLRTVEDRAKFFKRTLTPENQPALDKLSRVKHGFLPDLNGDGILDWRDLEVESERIRLLVDTNSDGHADVATTLAEGFDGITSGVAAGILAHQGEVWFTCIPEL